MLSVEPVDSLTRFDPLDGRPRLTSPVVPGALPTFATADDTGRRRENGRSTACACVLIVADPDVVPWLSSIWRSWSWLASMGSIT